MKFSAKMIHLPFASRATVIMSKKEMIGNIDVSGWRISGEEKNDLLRFVNNDPTLEELEYERPCGFILRLSHIFCLVF